MSNTDSRISILMYHQVARFKPMKTHRATYCQLRRFVAQMRWLALSRTSVISLDQCSRILHGQEAMPPHAVVLTFDDGYENFADNALPVLARYGFPATVYEPTGFIGGAADWLARDQLRPEAILSAEQLRALAGNPLVRIGAHGVHHRRLAEIPLHEAKSEIEESKAGLESLLQRPVRHLCYPYGSVDPQIMRVAADAGFETATTCQRGVAQLSSDPMGLPRKAISFGDNLLGYIWKVHFKHALKGQPLRAAAQEPAPAARHAQ